MGMASVCYFDAPTVTFGQLDTAHERRIRELEARVAREMAATGAAGPARGIARPVYRSDGEWYPSVSEAARKNQPARADYICQAIKLGRKCRGWHWCYVDELPRDFFALYVAAHEGEASLWPWRRGCTVADALKIVVAREGGEKPGAVV